MERGKIITPRMEMMFSGIGRRSFSYDFMFIPKSKQESDRVEEIIKMFKIHMHSSFVGGDVREMEIPNYFNIRYMYRGNENKHLNKISTCANGHEGRLCSECKLKYLFAYAGGYTRL